MVFTGWRKWLKRVSGAARATTYRSERKTRRPLYLEFLETRVVPTVRNWTGLGTDNLWRDSANWSGNIAPAVGDDLVFPKGGSQLINTNDFTPGTSFNSITFTGGGYSLSGNPIVLGRLTGGSVADNSGAITNKLNMNLIFQGIKGTETFSASSNTVLTVTGQIVGPSSFQLKITNLGTVALTADNSGFTGPVTVNQGALQIQNANALGSNNATTVQGGAALQLKDVVGVVTETIVASGPGISGNGAIENVSGNNAISGNITFGANVVVGADGSSQLALGGTLSDNNIGYTLTKVGTGRLILSHANTYLGATNIEDGPLNIQDPNALGKTTNGVTVQFNPGSPTIPAKIGALELQLNNQSVVGKRLTISGPGPGGAGALRNVSGDNTWDGDITLGTSASIGADGASNLNIGGPADAAGIIRQGGTASVLTKEGTGRLILNRADTYTGATVVDQGALTANNAKAFNIAALTGGVTVVGRAALELEVSIVGVPLILNGPGINNTGALLNITGINSWTGDVSLPTDSSIGAVQGSQLTVGNLATGTGVISGRGGLTKYGLGEVILPNADTYLGTTEIRQGILTIENSTALGGIPPGLSILDQAGTIVDAGAALHLKGVKPNGQGSMLITEPLTLAGTGINNTGAVDNIDGVNIITGDVQLTGSTSLGVESGAGSVGGVVSPSELTMSGNISDSTGPFGVKKVGPNRLILSGFNLYGGVTEVAQGSLSVRGSNALGATDGTAATGTVVDTNAALEMQGGIQVIGEALTLNGPGISNTGALHNMADDNRWTGNVTLASNSFVGADLNSRLTMRGDINDGLNGFSITKAGGGKLVLGGNNTYGGGTHVLAGIVNVQSSSGLGLSTGGTVVENGGALETQVGVNITDQKLVAAGTGPGQAENVPLQWFPIGPASILDEQGSNTLNGIAKPGPASGRIVAIAADPHNAKVYYIAAASGGVWKTKNGGITWVPLTDNVPGQEFQDMFMGAIAIAPSDTNTIYAGTGEPDFSGDSFYGRGVLWSPDGGLTWKLFTGDGAFDRLAISKIVVNPENPNEIWVATENLAANGLFNDNNGVWHGIIDPTTGTATFDQVLTGLDVSPELIEEPNAFYQFTDLVIDPIPDSLGNYHLYVGVGIIGTGLDDAGIYESLNNGAKGTWIKTNAPSGTSDGTIKLTIQHNDPNQLTVLYDVITNATDGLKEIDQGLDLDIPGFIASFAKTAKQPPDYLQSPGGFGQGSYDSAIAVDPSNPNHVIVGGLANFNGIGAPFDNGNGFGIWETFDGGALGWGDIGLGVDGIAPHTDYHSIVFDANDKALVGNDGGIWRLADPTIPNFPLATPPSPPYNIHWVNLNANLQTVQFVGIAINPQNPSVAYGGTQDNGTLKYTGNLGWNAILTGDGGFSRLAVDPIKPDTVYAERTGISLVRSDNAGRTFASKIKGINQGDPSAFYVPFVMDPTNSSRLLLGTDHLYETVNRADQWTAIATPNQNGFDVKQGAVITAIAVPTNNPNVIYMSSGGDIFVTIDHGKHWQKRDIIVPDALGNNVTIDDSIDQLQVDPADQNILYAVRAVFNETTNPNRFGHVFRTLDGGLHWTDITGNLPDLPTYTLAVDPRPNPHVLYIGNDNGVWYNTNLGTSNTGLGAWKQLGVGMPNTQVRTLALDPLHDYLAAGTYGRGMFEIELDPALANAGAMRAVTGDSTWSGPITLSTTSTAGADAGSSLTLSGNIIDNLAGAGLVKNGPGTVSLTNTNTYGGKTVVNEGTLDVQSSQSLGTNNEVVVKSGGTLRLDGDGIIYTKHMTMAGLGAGLAGALDNTGGSNVWAGNITLSGNGSIGADPFTQLTIGDPSAPGKGVIDDGGNAYGLFKQGGGLAILTQGDSYSGDTTVDAGELNIRNTSALGSGRGTTHVMAGSALELQFDPSAPGPNVISGESLDLNGDGIFDLSTGTFRGALRNISGNNIWQGTVNLLTPASIGVDNDDATGTSSGNPLTLAGAVGDKSTMSSLSKVGDGELILANNNNYRGGTYVITGIINAQANQAFGTNDVGTTVFNGAAIEVQQPAGGSPLTVNQILHLNGTGINGGGALDNVVGNNTWSGTINFDTSSSISVENDSLGNPLVFTITGDISGLETSVIDKVGPGILFFPNANDYQGQTLVSSGILRIANGSSLGAGSGDGTFVTDGATLQIQKDKNGNPITVVGKTLQLTGLGVDGLGAVDNVSGNNVWNGPIILDGDSAIVVRNALETLTAASSISESVGGSSLIFNGPGTLAMTGGVTFDNSYTGATFVNSGTVTLAKTPGVLAIPGDLVIGDGIGAPQSAVVRLLQDGQLSSTNTNITINSDGYLDLNGHTTSFASLTLNGGSFNTGPNNNITITGNVTVNGSTLEVGDNSTLTIDGNLTLISGNTLLDTATSKLVVLGTILGKSDGTSVMGGKGGIYLNGHSLVIQPIMGTMPVDLEIDVPIIGSANESVTVAAPDPSLGNPGVAELTAVEQYTGGTFVTGATLLADGTFGAVTVSGGILGGHGTLGNLTATGGVVSPGSVVSPLATLTTANALFASAATFNVQLSSDTSFSLLNATGQVNLDSDNGVGSKLIGGLVGAYRPAVGTVFTIIQAAGGLSGHFSGLGNNSTVIVGGLPFTLNYTTNTVTLTRIKAGSVTQVAVAPTAPVFGQPVVFTAVVTPQAPATATPTGTVTFTVDTTTFAPITLDNTGKASTPGITNLGVGPHTFRA
ncbi:MAG TPA: autotransporter-associated beta strand repeat-containing protein, partial [Gemmataceae bacterium]|nr:autotransporter-associated beta strand repeat-containing protein [Gemmataceae bacterium]